MSKRLKVHLYKRLYRRNTTSSNNRHPLSRIKQQVHS